MSWLAAPSGYGPISTASRGPWRRSPSAAVVREPVPVHGPAPGVTPPPPPRMLSPTSTTRSWSRRVRRPEWSDLADDITVWSQDGYLCIGVNNQDRVSEAMALEYGDEVRPPSALFRSLSEDVREANKRWQDEMEAKGYVYGQGSSGSRCDPPAARRTGHPRARRLPPGRGRGAQDVPHWYRGTRP